MEEEKIMDILMQVKKHRKAPYIAYKELCVLFNAVGNEVKLTCENECEFFKGTSYEKKIKCKEGFCRRAS